MGPHGAAGGKTNFHSTDKKYSGVLLLLPGKKYTGVKHGRGGGRACATIQSTIKYKITISEQNREQTHPRCKNKDKRYRISGGNWSRDEKR